MVPDSQVVLDGTSFVQQGGSAGCSYREVGVRVSRSARLDHGVVLGRGTAIGDHAFISHATVGANCVIGQNASVTESHVWRGVYRCLAAVDFTHLLSFVQASASKRELLLFSLCCATML